MKYFKNNKGITLIALIITIIILLILAGISISALTGSGLFEKAKGAKEKSEKVQIKEQIEMAIMEIQIEEATKGNNVKLEILVDEENKPLENKLEGITAILNDNEIIGEYKGYKYKIDNNLKVTIEDSIKGISFNYTLNPKGYTNGNIILTVNAKSTNGSITNIDVIGLNKNVDGTFTITENKDYEVTVTDSTGDTKTKTLSIQKIDTVKPLDFTIEVSDIGATSFTITAKNVKDGEDVTNKSVTSGIDRYEYWVNGQCYNSKESSYRVTGLNTSTKNTVYVKVFDKANNDKQSNTIYPETTAGDYPRLTLNGIKNVDLASDALSVEAYDKDLSTSVEIGKNGNSQFFKIDKECWGKYLTFCHEGDGENSGWLCFRNDMTGSLIWSSWINNFNGNNNSLKYTISVKIPEESLWGTISTGQSAYGPLIKIYEIWCSEEDLTGNVYTNQDLPI